MEEHVEQTDHKDAMQALYVLSLALQAVHYLCTKFACIAVKANSSGHCTYTQLAKPMSIPHLEPSARSPAQG